MDHLPLAILCGLLVQSHTDLARTSAVNSAACEGEFLRHAYWNIVHLSDIVDTSTLFAREIISGVVEWAAVQRILAVRYWRLHNHVRIDRGEEGKSRGGPGCGCEHHVEFCIKSVM